MPLDVLDRAHAFLVDTQGLTPAEAGQALAVAADVLRKGLARLADAARADDGPGCVEIAHALKGNLLNLGLPDLAATAELALQNAQHGDTRAARAAGLALTQALQPLVRAESD